MKTALAIWFSLALVLTQAVGRLGAAMPADCTAQQHCCCGLDKHCCTTKAPDNSPATPVAPPSPRSEAQLQLALPLNHWMLCPVPPLAAVRSSFNSPLPHVGTVSIYQRNCAYLL